MCQRQEGACYGLCPPPTEQRQCKQTRTSPHSKRRRVLQRSAGFEWRAALPTLSQFHLHLSPSLSGARLILLTPQQLGYLLKGTVAEGNKTSKCTTTEVPPIQYLRSFWGIADMGAAEGKTSASRDVLYNILSNSKKDKKE